MTLPLLSSPTVFAIAFPRIAKLTGRLLEDRRGALTSEYVILVGTVGLLLVGALVSVGPMLLASYYRSRAVLMGPYPLSITADVQTVP